MQIIVRVADAWLVFLDIQGSPGAGCIQQIGRD